ncbi:MAG TPA: hypothetical protein VNO30_47980 [Kofleriaceae bacterium]|nr:hypothetical protein [Kofleriaceae bacterium]
MKRELMRPELDKNDFVQFNYWGWRASGSRGGTSAPTVKQETLA